MTPELEAIREGFRDLDRRMELYQTNYISKEVFERLNGLHDSFIHQNSVRLNELEMRLEMISRFEEQLKNNTQNIARLEKRIDDAPDRRTQYISTGIAIISVLIVLFQHIKVG